MAELTIDDSIIFFGLFCQICNVLYHHYMLSRMLLDGSEETVHYKSDEMVNFCGFRCATMSPITVFINVVFFTFIYE